MLYQTKHYADMGIDIYFITRKLNNIINSLVDCNWT